MWSRPSTWGYRRAALVVAAATFGALALLSPAAAGDAKELRPPSDVALVEATATGLSLSWNAAKSNAGVGRVAGYGLYSDGTRVGTTQETRYTFEGLACGTTYTLGVDSYDEAGHRSQIVTLTASTAACAPAPGDTSPPSTPWGVSQTGATATGISLAWNASADNVGVAGYGVYQNGASVGTTTETSFTFANLACGTTYTLGVDGFDAAGNRSAIATVTASTAACAPAPPAPDSTPPSMPAGVAQSGATTTSMALLWNPATDDVGVAGYRLYLDGAAVATTSYTTHTLESLACGTTYIAAVEAYDAAGNRSAQASVVASTSPCPAESATVSAQTGTTATTLSFAPEADARVAEAAPSTNYGGSYLRADGGSDPDVETYLRFAVGNVASPVQRAVLRVYATSSTVDGPEVYSTQNAWSENTIVWNGRPSRSGGAIAAKGTVSSGSWVEYDVTPAVSGAGTDSFVLATTSSDGVDIASRESSHAPQLVITTMSATDAQPPTAPTNLARTSANQTSIALSWGASSDNTGVAGYGLYVNGTSAGTTSGTSYTFAGLLCGTTYTLAVDAFDAAGNRSPRSTLSAATAACLTSPPPPPPAGDCTDNLPAGGDLSAFLASLAPGDVGCLAAATYEDGCSVGWSRDGTASQRIELRGVPGTVVRTNLNISGDYLTVRDFEISGLRRCASTSGINVNSAAVHVIHMRIDGASKHGMILHTGSSNAVIDRNFVRDVGPPGSTLEHGIYVQATGHRITNNVFSDIEGGYGIHLYSSPSNIVVAGNTTVGSKTRAGILIDTSGGNIVVVNNIAANNATNGINFRRCSAGGCVVDENLVWGNGASGMGGTLAGQATNTTSADPQFVSPSDFHLRSGSPAIDQARADYFYLLDLDGVACPQGAARDLGAYEFVG